MTGGDLMTLPADPETDGTGSPAGISALSLAAITAAVDSEDPTPGGGAVAACAGALAAALAGMAARFSARGAAGPGPFASLVGQAGALRARCLRLADDDAEAYAGYVAATRLPRDPDPEIRKRAVRAALDHAAAVPLELAGTAAELAGLAEQLARTGNRHLRSDAVTAALLASAVTRSAAVFVAGNVGGTDDPRIARARTAAAEADAAAQRCVALITDSRQQDKG
jgi:methenyltetrahydrofolate cyclohydrolase